MDGPGVRRKAVLLEPRGTLSDRSGEIDPWHRRALPVRRLGGQAGLAKGLNAEGRQVEERRDEPGRRDDLVGLDRQLLAAVRRPDGHGVATLRPALDPAD
jgi:hypothetical protein